MLIRILIISFVFFLQACTVPTNQSLISFDSGKEVDFKLIAYKSDKNSQFWVENQETGKIHSFSYLGAYKAPKALLGTMIPSRYVLIHNMEVVAIQDKKHDYVQSRMKPRREFKVLFGYESKMRNHLKKI